MVCLGPRKKEKKNEANTRGVKKQNAKSKNAKTSISPSPSVRNQLNEKNKNDSHDASLLNERAPSPNPQKAPVSRQTSIISTTRTIASRAASNASSLRRFPISEMKEEFKGLKLKVMLHLANCL
jgi:hypothetical protein